MFHFALNCLALLFQCNRHDLSLQILACLTDLRLLIHNEEFLEFLRCKDPVFGGFIACLIGSLPLLLAGLSEKMQVEVNRVKI